MNNNRRTRKTLYESGEDNRSVSVDIGCLVYNHGKYLRQALDGMLMQQTTFPVRIIIHDDASTDNSVSIILEYKKRYPNHIVAVIEEENMYQNGKSIWKKMFPYYTAKYIAYCEGDDFWIDKNKLQKQVDYLEQHLDCAACYHNILPVDNDGHYEESYRGMYTLLEEGDYTKQEIRQGVLKTQTASLVSWNYHPWLTEEDKAMYLKAKCNGDVKQLVICSSFGRIHYLSDVMAAHRRVFDQGSSWTVQNYKKNRCERFIGAQKRYMEQCGLYGYFHNEKVYPFNQIINGKISFCISARAKKMFLTAEEKRLLKDAEMIPFYAKIIYIPFFLWRCIKWLSRKVSNYLVGR